jgi:hypothetical protein
MSAGRLPHAVLPPVSVESPDARSRGKKPRGSRFLDDRVRACAELGEQGRLPLFVRVPAKSNDATRIGTTVGQPLEHEHVATEAGKRVDVL